MRVRPLELDDAEALRDLADRPDVARYGDHDVGLPIDAWRDWLGPPDANRSVALGAFAAVDDVLLAAARLSMSPRRRTSHSARLDLIAPEAGASEAVRRVVTPIVEAADRWFQLVRVVHRLPVDHAYEAGVFEPLGFAREGIRRAALSRGERLEDEAQLARVSGAKSPTGSPPPAPAPGPPVTATIRAVELADAPALARLYSEPSVAWGMLQLPFQRADTWTARLEGNDPDQVFHLVAEVDGEVVGSGAVMLGDVACRRHSGSIGMGVAPAFQGRSVGRQILDALIAEAGRRGVTRLELEVWVDNSRARRLYASRGFVVECEERAVGARDGGFADDLAMALLYE